MAKEPTNTEILKVVNKFSTAVDKRFEGIEKDLTKIKSTMVTKDYLDDKLADLRGDLVVLMRKEDKKLQGLIAVLRQRNVISENDVKQILAMEPFPQLSK